VLTALQSFVYIDPVVLAHSCPADSDEVTTHHAPTAPLRASKWLRPAVTATNCASGIGWIKSPLNNLTPAKLDALHRITADAGPRLSWVFAEKARKLLSYCWPYLSCEVQPGRRRVSKSTDWLNVVRAIDAPSRSCVVNQRSMWTLSTDPLPERDFKTRMRQAAVDRPSRYTP